MIINMTTIALRKTHYIDQTLESLFRSDGRDVPVNLILGSRDTSHVEKYRGRLNIVPWDLEAEMCAKWNDRRWNCTVNAVRALRHGDDEHCLCCEDDIRFTESWLSDLLATIEEIPETDYVLNLSQGNKVPTSKRYAPHMPGSLTGAQAIFYPRKALRNVVAQYVEDNITRSTNDILIGRCAKQYAVLYNTVPRLVGHIGQVTSFRKSPIPPRGRIPQHIPPQRGSDPPQSRHHPPRHASRARTRNIVGARGDSDDRTSGETLVAILRASLDGRPVAAEDLARCTWRPLARLALQHDVVPIVFRSLRDAAAIVPPEQMRQFKARYLSNAVHNRLARAGLEEIGSAFERDRIPLIVRKGSALVADVDEDAGIPRINEIDLLVAEDDLALADAQLRRIGFEAIQSGLGERRGPLSDFALAYGQSLHPSLRVQLRCRPFPRYQPYVFDRRAIAARARPCFAAWPSLRVMAPGDELVDLCLDAEQRAVLYRSLIRRDDWFERLLLEPGALRSLYGVAVYLQKRGELIDWKELVAVARRCTTDAAVHAVLELCRRTFAVSPPPGALPSLDRGRPRLTEHLAHEILLAARSAARAEPGGVEVAKRARRLDRLSRQALRASRTWALLFPQSACLRARYPGRSGFLSLRSTHLRDVVPDLWAEIRDRLQSAGRDLPARWSAAGD